MSANFSDKGRDFYRGTQLESIFHLDLYLIQKYKDQNIQNYDFTCRCVWGVNCGLLH